MYLLLYTCYNKLKLFMNAYLVGGFKHNLCSISYMGCHPSQLTNSYFSRWLKHVKTTNHIYIYRYTVH